MLNPNRPVIKWLNTQLSGVSHPVYSGIADSTAPPQYYVISSRSSQQGGDKCDILSSVSFTIECISKGDNFGFQDSDEMSDEILSRIDSNTSISLGAPFTANALFVADISNDSGLDQTSNVFRTLVTYNLTVTENL